jgi:glycosyltransferase involved in cell wall biosynthesis
MPARIKVLCVGPAINVRGGISRVIGKIKDRFPSRIDFEVVATYPEQTRYGSPDWKYRCYQFVTFCAAFVRVSLRAAFSHHTIFHVHLSERGSALRKGLLCVVLRSFGSTFLVHTHAAESALFHNWVPRTAQRLLIWGLCGARRTIVLTEFWHQYYADIFSNPAESFIVLPNPCDLPDSVPNRAAREHLNLLFLGRIGERKGAFDIIKAFADVPAELARDLSLTLAGDGDVDEARALATEAGCASRTSVLGWVSANQVTKLLETADGFLLPSRGEGMSIALLEALGSGLPVVTTPAGGTTDFLEHGRNGLLVEPGNVPAICRAMCELATDSALRERLGSEARKTATRFSAEQYIDTLTHLYEQIARGSSEPVQPKR